MAQIRRSHDTERTVDQVVSPEDWVTAASALGLTSRQLGIVVLRAHGKTRNQIAAVLGVSPDTVKTHITRTYDKLKIGKKIAAIFRVLETARNMPDDSHS